MRAGRTGDAQFNALASLEGCESVRDQPKRTIVDLVAAVESRRTSHRVLVEEFASEIRDRAMELCSNIGRMNRCSSECSSNSVSVVSCDRAFGSAIAVLTEKLVGGGLGRSLDRQKHRHGTRFDARIAVVGFLRTVRHEDVRRRWNKERGLLQRIQRADFEPGRQGYKTIARSVAAILAEANERGVSAVDRLGAVRRLTASMGLAPPTDDSGGLNVIPGLEVSVDHLVVVLSSFYRDACDVAPAGDDTVPWLPRVRRDIRRLSVGGPASLRSVVGDDDLDELIRDAWTELRLVLSVGAGGIGSASYWDRYFGRAYSVSRIADAAHPGEWAMNGDAPFLAS